MAFAKAHLAPTMTHQVGSWLGNSSANTSLHIEFCMNLMIKVQGHRAHRYRVKEIIVCVGLFPPENQQEASTFKMRGGSRHPKR